MHCTRLYSALASQPNGESRCYANTVCLGLCLPSMTPPTVSLTLGISVFVSFIQELVIKDTGWIQQKYDRPLT